MEAKEIAESIKKEIERIKEDSIFSAKGHFEDAKYWRCVNYSLMVISIASVCASLVFGI